MLQKLSALGLSWLVLLLTGQVESELVMEPEDVFAVRGSSVILPCYTNLSLPVSWEFERDDDMFRWEHFYKGNPGNIPDSYRYKYSVSVDPSGNQYNLTIKNVQPEDAGTYRCGDNMGLGLMKFKKGEPHHGATAELVVIDAGLNCREDARYQKSQSAISNVGLQDLGLVCTVTYNGKIPPPRNLSSLMMKIQEIARPLQACIGLPSTRFSYETDSSVTQEIVIDSLNLVPGICNAKKDKIDIVNVNVDATTESVNQESIQEDSVRVDCSKTCESSTTSLILAFIAGVAAGIFLLALIIATLVFVCLKRNKSSISQVKKYLKMAKKPVNDEENLHNSEGMLNCPTIEESGTLMGGCSTSEDGEEELQQPAPTSTTAEISNNGPSARNVEPNLDSSDRRRSSMETDQPSNLSENYIVHRTTSTSTNTETYSDEAPKNNINDVPRNLSVTPVDYEKLAEENKSLNHFYKKYFPAVHCGLDYRIEVIEHKTGIVGVTVVDDGIFVVCSEQSKVNVYNLNSLHQLSDIDVPGMKTPQGLAGCAHNKLLYINDDKCIYKVNLNSKSSSQWVTMQYVPINVSVTSEHSVLVTVKITEGLSKLVEYTSEGEQMRDVLLEKSIDYAWHAAKISSDQYIVSHGDVVSSNNCSVQHRVCLIDADGQIINSYGKQVGGNNGQLNGPYAVVLDSYSKHIFVADCDNDRVILLDTDLTDLGNVITKIKVDGPNRLYFNSATNQLLIGEHCGRLVIINPLSGVICPK